MKTIFNINSNKNHFICRSLAASSVWQDRHKYRHDQLVIYA